MFENLKRFFAKHWLTRKIFFCICRCNKCGKKLNILSFDELPDDLQEKYLQTGENWLFDYNHIYACPDKCEGEDAVYLIF